MLLRIPPPARQAKQMPHGRGSGLEEQSHSGNTKIWDKPEQLKNRNVSQMDTHTLIVKCIDEMGIYHLRVKTEHNRHVVGIHHEEQWSQSQ